MPDAGVGFEREAQPVVLNPELRTGRDVTAVEHLVDLQALGQLAGAIGAVRARTDEYGLRLIYVSRSRC